MSDADDELVVDFFRRRVGVGDPAFAHIIAEQLLPVPQTGHPGIGDRTVHRWTYQACEPAADGTRMFLATGKHGEQTFLVIDAAGEATDACYLDESESETSRAFWLRRRQARDPYALLDTDLMRFLGEKS